MNVMKVEMGETSMLVTLRFLYEFFFPQNSRREMGDLHQNMLLFSANARFLEHTWFTGLELGIFE